MELTTLKELYTEDKKEAKVLAKLTKIMRPNFDVADLIWKVTMTQKQYKMALPFLKRHGVTPVPTKPLQAASGSKGKTTKHFDG